MPRFFASLAALCLLAAPLLYAQKVTLRPFPMDGTFATTQVQDMTMVMSVDTDDSTMAAQMAMLEQEFAMRQTLHGTRVVTKEGDGTRLVQTLTRVQMEGTVPGQGDITVDSDHAASIEQKAMLGPIGPWIGQPVTMHIGTDGVTVDGLDSLVATLIRGGTNEQQEVRREAFEEMFTAAVAGSIALLPDEPVGVGDAFEVAMEVPLAGMGVSQMKGTFTVSAVEGSVVRYGGPVTMMGSLNPAGMPMALEMQGDGTIEVVYDAVTGAHTTTSDLTLAAQMDMTGMMGSEKTILNMLLSMRETQTVTRQ